jgi:hypothetical protein
MPDNKKVAKSDQLASQENRCREFATKLHAYVHRVYADEGAMNPPYFLPNIKSLIQHLKSCDGESLVIADHPARLGIKEATRRMVLSRIEEAGGKFISVHNTPSDYMEIICFFVLDDAFNDLEK